MFLVCCVVCYLIRIRTQFAECSTALALNTIIRHLLVASVTFCRVEQTANNKSGQLRSSVDGVWGGTYSDTQKVR